MLPPRSFPFALAALALPMLALAASDAGTPAVPPSSEAPDPEPTSSTREIVIELAWEKGVPVLAKASPHTLPAPRKAGRWMGRFALELAEGPALLERIRFNVPLMHEPPPARASYTNPPNFEQSLTTSMRVVFPHLAIGNRFELVDRASGRRWALPWPIDGELGRTPLRAVTKSASPAKTEDSAR